MHVYISQAFKIYIMHLEIVHCFAFCIVSRSPLYMQKGENAGISHEGACAMHKIAVDV